MSVLEATFISLGIDYAPEKFKSIRNLTGYSDPYNPPVKPYGGLWASPYLEHPQYMSHWHHFIYTCGNEALKLTLTRPCTLFKLSSNTKLLHIKSLDDVVLDKDNSTDKIYLPTFSPQCFSSIPKELRKLHCIDYKALSQDYDALYIDEGVLHDTLNAVEWLDLYNFVKYTLQLQESMLFHSWDVPTLFVLNKNCIEVLDIISPVQT